MPGGIEETVRNLREISPTVYFNVPKGYESLLPYLRDDTALRAKFFDRLHAMFFSGAALSPYRLEQPRRTRGAGDRLSRADADRPRRHRNRAVLHVGAARDTSRSGHVGLPVSGNDAKLVPNNGKLEVRAKGPNVTPGYWRQPELTAAAFDEEGFYKFGDALKPADPRRFRRRLRFRRPHRRGFQARQRHLGQRRPAARALHRGLRAAGARRRDRRHQPRRNLGAGDARSRRLPPDQSGAAVRRSRRGGGRSADPRRVPRAVDEISGDARRARRPGSRARCCSIRRCRSIAAKSPTRARSTSARCWIIAAR